MIDLLAALTILAFTLPAAGQLQVADSVGIGYECSGGPAIHELRTARLYFQPITGGPYSMIQEHVVSGMEGMPDSFTVGYAGHFYVTCTNPIGQSCASNVAYIAPQDPTGVPVQGADQAVASRTFDVRGRLLRGPPRAVGIYFQRTYYRSGKFTTHRLVILK